MAMDQDRTIQYTYFYALGPKISIGDQILTVRDFWRYLVARHPPPKTSIIRDPSTPSRPTRTFAQPVFTNVLVFEQLFPQDHIQYIRDFDIDDIRFKTVKDQDG